MTGGHIRNRRALKSTTTNNTPITGMFAKAKGVDIIVRLKCITLIHVFLLLSVEFRITHCGNMDI